MTASCCSRPRAWPAAWKWRSPILAHRRRRGGQGRGRTANTGTGKLSGVTVTDSTNANLRNPAAIVFTSATTYTIDGGRRRPTRRPDHQRQWLELRAGRCAEGRRYLQHHPDPGGSSDNSNALAGQGGGAKAFNAGTVTLNGALGGLTTQVGAAARAAEYSLDAQLVINDKAQEARDRSSGVNLDGSGRHAAPAAGLPGRLAADLHRRQHVPDHPGSRPPMSSRISTSMMFNQSVSLMMAKQAKLSHLEQQIATGSKIVSAKDDPVAAGTAVGLTAAWPHWTA
jgi:hypothetical protein